MRKYIVLILFVILSCQPEELELIGGIEREDMIFAVSESKVVDGQTIFFNILSEEEHQLVISKDGSVITKESFLPTLELNTRQIYTKSLPTDLLKLELINSNGVIKSTFIQIN